ncbi:MAG: c-type cytochrome [Pseudobdellovibrionaceae bacterium]
MKYFISLLWSLTLCSIIVACQPSLSREARLQAYAKSEVFADQSSARPWPEGVLPRNFKEETEPIPKMESLRRGQEQFNIYCQVCHGLEGEGNGMAVQRGFPKPPSFHEDRLRQITTQYFYDVATRGFGRMASYANRISKSDRWLIAQYIRALQLHKHFPRSALEAEDYKRENTK